MTYWLRECPRCRGDLREEQDQFGPYISCVQCGYILNGEQEAFILSWRRPLPARPAEELAA